MSLRRRAVGAALWIALAGSVAGFLALAIGPRLLPYRTVTMLTGSMGEAAPAGSLVVDVAEPVTDLRRGQVISFHPPLAGRPVVTHRVLSVERHEGQVFIRTRGDANATADPWLARIEGPTVWRMRAVVPHLGTVVRLLRGDVARPLLVWGLPALLLATFLTAVWRPQPTASEIAEGGGPACPTPPAAPAGAHVSPWSPSARSHSRHRLPGRRRAPSRPPRSRRPRRPSHHRRH